jgi:hypothetical protein
MSGDWRKREGALRLAEAASLKETEKSNDKQKQDGQSKAEEEPPLELIKL